MSEFHTILPSNASTELRAIERSMAEPKIALHEPITALWDVNACPDDVLPWLAWGLSVDMWDADWSQATKRRVVAKSIEIHRIKGTRGAVELALGAVGLRVEIVEGWQDGGAPHTFRVDVYVRDIVDGRRVDAALVAYLRRLIDVAKPVRSHYGLRLGIASGAEGVMRPAARVRQRDRIAGVPSRPSKATSATASVTSGTRVRQRQARSVGITPQMIGATASRGLAAMAHPRFLQAARISWSFPSDAPASIRVAA